MTMNEALTALLTLLTGIYAFLTSRILRANEAVVSAMRAEREAASRPYITIAAFTTPGSVCINLRVENTGRTAAHKVRLTVDRPFQTFADPHPEFNLQSFPAFSEVIESFGAGMRLPFALATGGQLFGKSPGAEALVPKLFYVSAAYSWDGGSAQETSAVDLRPFGRTNLEPDSIVDQLEKLRNAIEAKKL